MLRLGAHTFGFLWQASAEAAFAAIAEAGFTQIQLMAATPHFAPWREDRARTQRLRRILERNGMSLLALDLPSSEINLASPSPEVVSFAVNAYALTVARCAELGAKWVSVGSGRQHGLLSGADPKLLEMFHAAFVHIAEEARRHGVGVILENHPQGLLCDAASIDRFLARESREDVRVTYDVANAFAIGENPVEGLRRLAPRLGVVHVSDSPIGQWRHDPVGSGAIDFAAIGACLAEQGFEGPIALEVLSGRPLDDMVEGAHRLAAMGWTFADPLPTRLASKRH